MVVRIVLLALLIGCTPPFVSAQEKQDKDLTYEVSVSAITIAVTVEDRRGRLVNDLTEKDFAVYENNVQKDITYFKHDFEAPVSLTILLDVSGSMGVQNKLTESREALTFLLKYLLRPQDEVSLLIFADGEVEVPVPFSTDKNGPIDILADIEAYGQTALNDAVAVSPEYANKGRNEKRALLLITDGIENDSQSTVDQALQIARRVDVPIYTIGYKIPLSEQYLKKYKTAPGLTPLRIIESLQRFSRATGGEAYIHEEFPDLRNTIREIYEELTHQYIIGYTTYKALDDAYRIIRVVTPKKRFTVRTREGY